MKVGAPSSLADRPGKSLFGAVFDVLAGSGIAAPGIAQRYRVAQPKRKLAGPISTLSGAIVDLTEDESLLRW